MTATTTTHLTFEFEQPRMNLAHEAPNAYRALRALAAAVELDPELRELVNMRASVLNGCAFCIDMHTKDARAAGETEQRLYAVAAWHDAPFFSDRERAALALTDAITRVADGHVPADVYRHAEQHFSQSELANLIWAITVINAWNRIALATRMLPGKYEARARPTVD